MLKDTGDLFIIALQVYYFRFDKEKGLEKQIDGFPVYKQPIPLKYYTYVTYSHGKLFIRGIDQNDRRVSFYSDYTPMIWVPLEFNYNEYKQDIIDVQFNKWTCLIDNKPLVGLRFKSIYACNQFVRQNTKVSRNQFGAYVRDTRVHTSPNNMFVSQYIAENFPGEIHLASDKLRVITYDIETEIGHRIVPDDTEIKIRNQNTSQVKQTTIQLFEDLYNDGQWKIWSDSVNDWITYDNHPYRFIGNFPDPLKADEKIILITAKDINNNRIDTWGIEKFDNTREDVHYHQCKDEQQLLTEFIDYIVNDYPDIITGWNCLNKNSTVWMNDRIVRLQDIKQGDQLIDSNVLRVSNSSLKDEYQLQFGFGTKISASKDHIFPVIVYDHDQLINTK